MALELHYDLEQFRAACEAVRQEGRRLALVPTMGALHEGHLALIDEARRRADDVAVTIFVNPTQFGPDEDFSRYPRQLDRDLELCQARGAALAFSPNAAALYPAGEQTRVSVGKLAEPLCGKSRPGHFTGVGTVVAKLLTIAGPCTAVFGKKDYQQLKVIERLVRDLCLPVAVVGHPIVREKDGLALSSRNVYLSSIERERALGLVRGLDAAWLGYAAGERAPAQLKRPLELLLAQAEAQVDYVEILDAEDLSPIEGALSDRPALLAVAAYFGKTRLIDNCVLGVDLAPLGTAGL